MDLVTQNLMSAFRDEESLPKSLDDSEVFEHFVNFCAISSEYGEEFDVEEIHTGGGDDLGLDGIAVVVNGALVSDVDEVDDLAAANKFLEVEFIFCQAKSGGSFSGNEISSFFFGVKDIFSANPALPRNERVSEKEALIRAIYKKSTLFKRGNPLVRMYYATTGKWQEDTKLVARINHEREALLESDIFRGVDFTPVDARHIQRLYGSAKNRFSKSIEFPNKVTLPALHGIQESYLGYLPSDQFLKLITDDSGNIVRGLFYDNVRDFQGDNPVNIEIDDTLKSEDRQLFVLMNNGVTVVADSITKTGDVFNLEDFQIVNGCQTSHVLFNNRAALEKPVHIPIKLIVSQDGLIKNRIIKATNRQTMVKTEELTALTDFQKSLEDYYNAVTGDCRLFYERRSQQYRAASGIEKIRIVSIPNQIRSFASMFLGLPHQASRYYGTLLNSIESKIFIPDHLPVAYYASALGLYRFESLSRRKAVDAKYRPFKYHLLPIARILMAGNDMPPMNSHKFEKYCGKIVAVLQDEKESLAVFSEAAKLIDYVLGGDYGRDKAKDASLFSNAALLIKA
ncbi:MAG: AIPR family protein [Thiobacillus sp.]|nr:AIPR family protein [Bellilinea sp.]